MRTVCVMQTWSVTHPFGPSAERIANHGAAASLLFDIAPKSELCYNLPKEIDSARKEAREVDNTAAVFERLPEALLPWYRENRRQLPWREDREPYHIWISEIMLQQTRVEAVKGYYRRFLVAFPDIAALAGAEDGLLHKLWEGLGYYSRVRNLKKAAIRIQEDHGGIFPRDHSMVRKLPGIGPYTAGAICSIAFGQPTPAVDGNVLRVVSRLTDDSTPIDSASFRCLVEERLRAVYPPEAGEFTQALMELGATVCGPNRKPDCQRCPCGSFCLGYSHGTAEALPAKLPKLKKRQENRTVFLLRCGEKYALEKRPEAGLLAGLWQFPNVPGFLEPEEAVAYLEGLGIRPREILRQTEKKHIFTHIRWDMRGLRMDVEGEGGGFCWLTPRQIREEAALPTAFRQFWESEEAFLETV